MYDEYIFSEGENDPEEEDGDDPTYCGMRVLHEKGVEDPDGQEQADVAAMMDQDLVNSETCSIVEIERDNATRGGGRGVTNPEIQAMPCDVGVEIQDVQAVEGWAPLSTSLEPRYRRHDVRYS